MTNCARAGGCAVSLYPFLTQQERDNETGLDYFRARYYSSAQGRFTSPDEFTGEPEELYSFAATASRNPTFYADVAEPQSLNKYQYTLNNPLGYVDPDGHDTIDVETIKKAARTNEDVFTGIGKGIANIGIGINNLMADFKTGADYAEAYQGSNRTQKAAMVATEDLAFFLGLLGGKARVGGVAVSESQTTAVTASRVATNEAAISTANQAQRLSAASRPGAAGAAKAVTGEMFTTTSGRGPLHPVVQTILDDIPVASRSATHGACCEAKLTSQMLYAGVSPKGATFSVVRVRAAGNIKHATPIQPCSTCRLLLDAINK